jgi:hypothetical protein
MLGSQHHDLATIRNECRSRQIEKQSVLHDAGNRLELCGQIVSVPNETEIAIEELVLLIGHVRPIGPRFVHSQ